MPPFMGQSSNVSNLQELCTLKGSKFTFLNIRSLPANFSPLKADLESLMDTHRNNFIVIGLSESWLNGKLHSSLFEIQGFTLHRLDRESGKKGGGIAVFVNDKFRVDQVSKDLNVSNGDIILYSIIIQLPNQKSFLLSTVYTPPKSNYIAGLQYLERCSVL